MDDIRFIVSPFTMYGLKGVYTYGSYDGKEYAGGNVELTSACLLSTKSGQMAIGIAAK